MKEIPLTRDAVALVDDEDFERINSRKWYLHSMGYAARSALVNGKHYVILMHREIFPTESPDIDHIDGNKLNNQKGNLRACTRSQNSANRPKNMKKPSTSRYKGVSWSLKSSKWVVHTSKNNKVIHVGYYDVEEDAARAYDEFSRQVHGEFGRLNFEQ